MCFYLFALMICIQVFLLLPSVNEREILNVKRKKLCRMCFEFFLGFVDRIFRYTDSVMNYQSMGPSASSFAQFYHQAAANAVSAANAGVVGGVGDSLGKYTHIFH